MLDAGLRDLFDQLFDKLDELNQDDRISYEDYCELYDDIEALEHACEARQV